MTKQIDALKLALEAYLCREMPEGTVIGDPKWWAPKIAAAIEQALSQPDAFADGGKAMTAQVADILDRLEIFVGGLGEAIFRELRTALAQPEPSKYGSPELQALILDKLAQPEQGAIPHSGADESPPVFGRRWKLAQDGFGLQRDDANGNYVHIDDALSVLHQSAQPPLPEQEPQDIAALVEGMEVSIDGDAA